MRVADGDLSEGLCAAPATVLTTTSDRQQQSRHRLAHASYCNTFIPAFQSLTNISPSFVT
jgi:hypothetical protein